MDTNEKLLALIRNLSPESVRMRDRVGRIAEGDNETAYGLALGISDPWCKAQALADVARFSEDVVGKAFEARDALMKSPDMFERVRGRHGRSGPWLNGGARKKRGG